MTGIAIAAPGGPDMLQAHTLPVPEPAEGSVLIRVAGAGVNYPDLLHRAGFYDPPPGHSPLPGLEVSGVIEGLGPKVEGLSLGDRVVALCNGGGYAEFVTVPAGQVLPLPQGWSFAAGAALPETFFTIAQTLLMRAGLSPGMQVLVHGAAGGIGGAAVQIAHALGAHPIAVVSNAEKAAYARALGAVHVIEHGVEDFVERTLALTGGRGADRIIAMAGSDMLARNIAAASPFGTIVQLAALGGGRAEIPIQPLLSKCLTLIGSVLRAQDSSTKAAIAATLRDRVWPFIAQGTIVPPRILVLPLEEAAAAHQRMEDRSHFGKIVLVTPFGTEQDTNNAIAPGQP